MPKTDLVIFDWNGTLTDKTKEQAIAYGSVCEIFRQYGIPVPPPEVYYREISSDFMRSFYWPHGIPKTATIHELNIIREKYFHEHWNPDVLNEDAREILLYLKRRDIPAIIVSSEVNSLLIKGIKEAKLDNLIAMYCSECWPQKKPFLEQAVRIMSLGNISRCLFVDDHPVCVRDAKELGMVAVAYTRGYCPEEEFLKLKPPPDFLISRLSDLQSIIR